jgi:PHD/YefM family antitoxin component YafN of YafNO toxin-antitoxin module
MVKVHPQFIKDEKGQNTLVVLPANEFNAIMEELEELEDIRLYDEAVAKDDGERILFSDYLKKRKSKNAEIQGGIDQKS